MRLSLIGVRSSLRPPTGRSSLGHAPFVSPALAEITVGHVDDFQDGTTQHWRIGQPNPFPKNVANAGPQGMGDHALFTYEYANRVPALAWSFSTKTTNSFLGQRIGKAIGRPPV